MQRLLSDKKFAWCRVFDQPGLIRLQRAPPPPARLAQPLL